ncbi:MAG: Asp23/Gls24 family envelope stress response protein, partial [Actinomycetota bacterium]|nr:Asp23/Gls24 family envelope stress response protein [Actinomycetota bacterium]
MSDEIKLHGLGVAPGVLETIVTLAAQCVDGVVFVGTQGIVGLVQKNVAKGAPGVEVVVADDGAISVTLHIEVEYGKPLRAVASSVQDAVADAITSQVG